MCPFHILHILRCLLILQCTKQCHFHQSAEDFEQIHIIKRHLIDQTVPLPNSLLLAMALWKAGIPVELHVYPEGIHGLSLANELVECLDGRGVQEECTSWISLVDTWLDRLMKKEGEE